MTDPMRGAGPWIITASLAESIPNWAVHALVHPTSKEAAADKLTMGVGYQITRNFEIATSLAIPPGEMHLKDATGTMTATVRL